MCSFRSSLLKKFWFKMEKNTLFNCGSKIWWSESAHKLSSPSKLMYANATQQFNSLLSPTTIQTGQNELKSFLKEHTYFHIISLCYWPNFFVSAKNFPFTSVLPFCYFLPENSLTLRRQNWRRISVLSKSNFCSQPVRQLTSKFDLRKIWHDDRTIELFRMNREMRKILWSVQQY